MGCSRMLQSSSRSWRSCLEVRRLWELLTRFWSEMILYIAPSDNLDAHAEAIARGGELITLIWALLTHIGIVDRPDDTAAATTSSS